MCERSGSQTKKDVLDEPFVLFVFDRPYRSGDHGFVVPKTQNRKGLVLPRTVEAGIRWAWYPIATKQTPILLDGTDFSGATGADLHPQTTTPDTHGRKEYRGCVHFLMIHTSTLFDSFCGSCNLVESVYYLWINYPHSNHT